MKNEIIERIAVNSGVDAQSAEWHTFVGRLNTHYAALYQRLHALYGDNPDFPWHLENILVTAAKMWHNRPDDLKALDDEREHHPEWVLSQEQVGGVCYVDLFAQNLEGIRAKIPYFKALGLTYLHLMPLFDVPVNNNDGGYAVSSYRKINPKLGTMSQLQHLTHELRENGISLCLDFIFNHTSDEHMWALAAQQCDEAYRDFYLIFPDRTMPDQYEQHVREIFPDEHAGAFTSIKKCGAENGNRWVWTTFHSFQWDLNYANPAVFNAMAEEMLFIANVGVEILRMDAVAFIWKQLGTNCENLPEAHTLIQAFNVLCRIAAPALVFKSEAIVHPDDVVKYIRPDECQISYNPLLMAMLWESLATRKVSLLCKAMNKGRFNIHPSTTWVNYVRCHDDIGWTFSDEDAWEVGINGNHHRQFLNAFYTGRFEGSFARGLPFQENHKTGDCRISGTCASLVGIESALDETHSPYLLAKNTSTYEHYVSSLKLKHAIARHILIHGIAMAFGGVPLLYLGDEIGVCNDYGFIDDQHKKDDSRWVHRVTANQKAYERRHDHDSLEGMIYDQLHHLIQLRKHTPAFAGNDRNLIFTDSEHVLAFERHAKHNVSGYTDVLVIANFSEVPIETRLFEYTMPCDLFDLISQRHVSLYQQLKLQPYQLLWLVVKQES
jgi:amylosucrase